MIIVEKAYSLLQTSVSKPIDLSLQCRRFHRAREWF